MTSDSILHDFNSSSEDPAHNDLEVDKEPNTLNVNSALTGGVGPSEPLNTAQDSDNSTSDDSIFFKLPRERDDDAWSRSSVHERFSNTEDPSVVPDTMETWTPAHFGDPAGYRPYMTWSEPVGVREFHELTARYPKGGYDSNSENGLRQELTDVRGRKPRESAVGEVRRAVQRTTAKLAAVHRRSSYHLPLDVSLRRISRGLSTVGLLLPTTRANLGEVRDCMQPERRVTRSMSRPGETVEETERRMLEELRQSLGPLPGAIDTPEGSTQGDDFYPPLPFEPPPQQTGLPEPPAVRTGSEDSGQTPRPREGNTGGRLSSAGSEVVGGNEEEATTQKMMLAIMNMMMEMNKDMIAERKRQEEQEKKKEQETVGGIGERREEVNRGGERGSQEKWQSTAKIEGVQPKGTNGGRAIPTDVDELNRRWPRPSADEVLKRREEGKCTGCGERGHYNRDCPVIAAKVKAGIIPLRSFGQNAGGEGRFSTGGNAVPLGDRKKINAVGREEAGVGERGMDEEEKDGDPSR
ncbi:hypothetical protein TREMEDRAFT_58212 [Tremella mesenterica DSM 1558]|uniref:uncharacterized protein n=1 Tax=Tremella mesenterica (strain ATCC 24925 / CBS 8224 / DSM 1558 / NBRC 9311 / NRRL Y-6157 / RJB 2259-6 / UBC 559-6) TaxID=578456 RepID=UPI0003F498CB|nr:uncharacterized protein TREMEDRAFT_58212 [Tremella mesenterica DSM 1558]EIW72059.1 hypothetical protein TREMEDRAFT_58212 [Tremella mesenterica DSM 1558]